MKRVRLDSEAAAIQEFVRALPLSPEGVELELNGRVFCTVFPSFQFSDAEKEALLQEGQELVRRARERNMEVPGRVIEREVRVAVKAVRSKQR